ncbi:hypothetical protein [Methylobacterium marchantiae]|uniref:Uncharacterized protein n=1 Tax=Methylobacterium marchantiae TaxID=600331 RepID=A0ABW3X373_9HYPH
MAGESRRHGPLHGLKFGTGIAAAEVEEDRGDAVEIEARALQGFNGVGEARRFGIAGDSGNLGIVRVESCLEGGQKMLRPDAFEGRKAERRLPYGFGERSDVPGFGSGWVRHHHPSASAGPVRGNLAIPGGQRKEFHRHSRIGAAR